ncbi:Oxidoreductase UcpA [Streptomyces sp. RB5]|uniref:Oxidoreductase UcpA n=1 Tax=Streptomyces smaragdinus TaxID=2585196 RepID=A0A7K0CDR5_9ACTN|nr:SDR family oxidoreductase [Streptomyces smaragdinus]MQY11618.1 Oxidoreductase UcpA [Streptomyces smaragdinus]
MTEHDAPRTALVTGANRGIGLAVAAELAAHGLTVVVTARRAADARAAAAEIGPGARALELDVTDDAGVRRAAERAGDVDVLVCNAGVLLDGGTDPLSAPPDAVEETLRVNVVGTWRVLEAFVPPMVRRGRGSVVIVSSGTTPEFGGRLFAGAPGYSLSKSALNNLTTLVADHTRGSGVTVNAVNPGRVRTRMMPHMQRSPKDAARFVAETALRPPDGVTGGFLTENRGPG